MIHWEKIYKLSQGEFSEDPDKYANPKVISGLSYIRKFTQRAMYPSPVSGALARFSGSKTSQHYVGNKNNPERKSTACDVFCEGIPFSIYSSIVASRRFRGVGLYLDTNGPDGLPWIMFHLDIRRKGFNANSPLIWIVERVWHPTQAGKKVDKYRYPQAEPKYWSLLNDDRVYYDKQFGIKSS